MEKLLKLILDIGFRIYDNDGNYAIHKYMYNNSNKYSIEIHKNGNNKNRYKILFLFEYSKTRRHIIKGQYFNSKEDIQQCIEDLKIEFKIELRKIELNKLLEQ